MAHFTFLPLALYRDMSRFPLKAEGKSSTVSVTLIHLGSFQTIGSIKHFRINKQEQE